MNKLVIHIILTLSQFLFAQDPKERSDAEERILEIVRKNPRAVPIMMYARWLKRQESPDKKVLGDYLERKGFIAGMKEEWDVSVPESRELKQIREQHQEKWFGSLIESGCKNLVQGTHGMISGFTIRYEDLVKNIDVIYKNAPAVTQLTIIFDGSGGKVKPKFFEQITNLTLEIESSRGGRAKNIINLKELSELESLDVRYKSRVGKNTGLTELRSLANRKRLQLLENVSFSNWDGGLNNRGQKLARKIDQNYGSELNFTITNRTNNLLHGPGCEAYRTQARSLGNLLRGLTLRLRP